MMKTILIIVLFFLTSLSAEIVKKYYSSGELKSNSNIEDGKREGLSEGFYKDGKIKYISYYKNNLRQGLTKSYYQDSTLKAEQNYINGLLNGLSKKYYKNGVLKAKLTFKDDLPLSAYSFDKDGKEIK